MGGGVGSANVVVVRTVVSSARNSGTPTASSYPAILRWRLDVSRVRGHHIMTLKTLVTQPSGKSDTAEWGLGNFQAGSPDFTNARTALACTYVTPERKARSSNPAGAPHLTSGNAGF